MPSNRFRCCALLLFALLICARVPGVWHGRVWAEEGLFYQNAWTMPAGRALLTEYGGYLNLVANAAGVLARYLVPLADIPWVLTGIGLVFQLCPAVLIVTSRARWLQNSVAMTAACCFLATSSPAAEVFLQTLHSQYHLLLGTTLILCFDDETGPAVRWLRRAVLLLAPLCGLLPVVLLPLFAARVVLDRTQERLIQAGLLLAGAGIQMGVFYSPAGGAALGRADTIWPGLLLQLMAVRQVVTPLLGLQAGTVIGDGVRGHLLAHAFPLWPVVLLVGAMGALGLLSLRRLRSGAVWLLVPALMLAAVSYYGAVMGGTNLLEPKFGERYSFAPDILIEWTLICLASAYPIGSVSRGTGFMAAWVLVVSLLALPHSFANLKTGPNWHAEAAAWEADPAHVLQLWPAGWSMELRPDHASTPLAHSSN